MKFVWQVAIPDKFIAIFFTFSTINSLDTKSRETYFMAKVNLEFVKQVKAENDMNARHDIGQNVILDTIQQLKQQITEQKGISYN